MGSSLKQVLAEISNLENSQRAAIGCTYDYLIRRPRWSTGSILNLRLEEIV